jgi:endonuclease YncB( thermonuclease family)
VALLIPAGLAHSEPLNSAEVYVIDGDTIAVLGKTIRLVGFDAPELVCGGLSHC